jgi:hypothetical protein
VSLRRCASEMSRGELALSPELNGAWAVWGLKLLLIGILALAPAYSFGWGLPFVIVWWVQYVANAILLILLIFSLASFWNGTTVESIARRCEVTLEKRIERKLVELAEE